MKMELWIRDLRMNSSMFSQIPSSESSRNFLKILWCMISLLMRLLQVFGKIKMLRKVFYASYLEESLRNSLKVEEAVSEAKSTSFFVVILQPPKVSCFSMCTR